MAAVVLAPVIAGATLSAPTGLTATAISGSAIQLRWTDTTSGESGFEVQQSRDATTFSLIAAVAQNATSYQATGLLSGVRYYYRVRAIGNGNNVSPYSTIASAVTLDTIAPGVPTNLFAQAVSCGQVNLSWSAVSDAGGSGLKGYNVYRNGAFVQQVLAPTTSAVQTAVVASTSYTFAVSAIDNAGNESAKSASQTVTTPACGDTTKPSVPTGLTATPISCGQVNLAWTASTDTGGSGLKGYNVYRNGGFVKQVLAPTTSTSDSGLTASTLYSYTVAAIDNAGNQSAQSTATSAATPACTDATPPSVPTGLTATVASCSQVNLAWSASTDSGGSGLRGYWVFRNGAFLKVVLAPATTTYDIVSGGATYTYTVAAIDNANNLSAQSTGKTATTPLCADTTPPSVPTGLTTSVVSCSQINLGWSASTDAGTGLKGYNLYRNNVFLKQVLAPATSTSDTGLTGSSSYTYTVSAVDNAGNESAKSAASGKTTPACLANTPPVANAGPDVFTQTLTGVTFSGSGSYDPDGTIATYAWAFGDGTTASGMTVTHSYATAGSYTATLTVTDNGGLTARDTAAVSITNRAPTANAGPDQTAAPGAVVTFSGAGSSDSDGTIASYTWSFGDGATGTGVTTNHVYATAGTYTARLTITDNLGATGTDTATISVAATTATGSYVWAKGFGSAGDDRGDAVAVDRDGNVFMAGAFTGTVNFGTGSLTSTHFSWLNATDYKDVVIAKYAPSGAALWVRQIGAESNDGANAIAVDSNGDVVVTGYCSNSVDFGNGVLTTSGGDYDIFVAKYSGLDGHYLWAKRIGTVASEYGYGVAVDGSGNVFATGVFYGTANFGTASLTSVNGTADAWLVKYSATGTPLWAKQIGGTGTDFGYGVAVDGSGNAILVGRMSGTVNLGGGSLTSAGGYDVFLAKYAAADGQYLWGKRFGGTGDDYGDAVAVDANADVYVTGNFPGTVNLGGGAVTSFGSTDGFVAKYAGTDGHYVWAKPFGGTGGDAGSGVGVDGQGNVTVTGYFSGVVNFGTGAVTSAGATDGFAVKYTSAGTPLWTKRFGGTATDFGTRVAADTGGNVNVIGSYSGTADFGGGPIISAGAFDMFLLRLRP